MKFFDLFKRGPRQPEPDIAQTLAEEDAVVAALAGLALTDAEREASIYLTDPGRFRTEASTGEAGGEAAYGPLLRQFFCRYRRVVSARSQVELEGGGAVRAEFDASLYVIGFHAEHTEVYVAAGTDEIMVLGTDVDPPEVFYRFPSIYHFLCFLGRTETV